MKNPIAKITAAIILVISLVAVIGLTGAEIPEQGYAILNIMIGASITFLFVSSRSNQASNSG